MCLEISAHRAFIILAAAPVLVRVFMLVYYRICVSIESKSLACNVNSNKGGFFPGYIGHICEMLQGLWTVGGVCLWCDSYEEHLGF